MSLTSQGSRTSSRELDHSQGGGQDEGGDETQEEAVVVVMLLRSCFDLMAQLLVGD